MRILTRWPANYDAAVSEVLASALGNAPASRVEETLKAYRKDDQQTLFVAFDGGGVMGCVGIKQVDDRVVVQHVSVRPDGRRHGIARRLITEVLVRHPAALEAETDDDTVSFYRRLGFNVTLIRSPYPTTTRYRCTLPAPSSRFSRPSEKRVVNW